MPLVKAVSQDKDDSTLNGKSMGKYITQYLNLLGIRVSQKKLQKLLYYVQAWHLVHFNRPLVDEDFQAWIHGPVLPSLYHEYKRYGFNDINLIDDEKIDHTHITNELQATFKLEDEQVELIHTVLNKYGSLSSMELELLTHSEKPWTDARENYGPHERCTRVIEKQVMREFYAKMIA